MAKKLEADLDPVGTRSKRPGAKIAERAVANSKAPAARKPRSAEPTRPGAAAAARAVAGSKRKRLRSG